MDRVRSWEYLATMTARAINDATCKWYADCYLTEYHIQRLMLWQARLESKLKSRSS